MEWIFVYGTLRSAGTAGHLLPGARRAGMLAHHALYGRTMPYPMATPEPGGTVIGEVVALAPKDAPAVLVELDRYEGDEYRRTSAPVTVDRARLRAHLWVAARPDLLDPSQRIASGDWFDRWAM